jgi:hypothetical protein
MGSPHGQAKKPNGPAFAVLCSISMDDYRYFPKQFRQDTAIPEHWQDLPVVRRGKPLPFLLLFALTLSMCGIIFIVLKVLSVLAR